MFTKYRLLHFVGIGGVGMSGIAEVLHNLGYTITGSDLKESETAVRLKKIGIKVFIGHNASNVADAHVVVISSAVSPENPEVVAAKSRGIPVIPRAEMLAELGRLKYGILVAGAHGKTTTTSLVATILGDAGVDPTVVIGGRLNSMGTNAKLGQGDFLVAEADESDGSFLKLSPTIAVITNIDKEHMDFFEDLEILKHAFLSFINKVPFYGIAVVCLENPYIRELLPCIGRRVLTYGLTDAADIYARDIKRNGVQMSFEAVYKKRSLGVFTIPIPGLHNVLNSTAAIAVAMELDIPVLEIAKALSSFGGIHRRFEFKGEVNGTKVFDDYGHHPSEISATVKAAKECFPENRVVVLFQPHRYTRTRDLMDEFTCCFEGADMIFLLDIYPAGEKPLEGVSSGALLKKMDKAGLKNVVYLEDASAVTEKVAAELKCGDVLVTLGAGNVYRFGEAVLERLK
ncbi:MAG: UDP-N-acetylmuramate--L-alanine ligase [Nitrospirae bacterium]|nr:MAG: UDP-N-acetylmuramate--L-alanine ligase [Nitrospirota bacterium]